MIRRSDEKIVDRQERKLGGNGHIFMTQLINERKELNDKGRMFNHVTLAPHSGIGYHVHHGESEIYFILSGTADYNDNETLTTVGPGDVTFTFDGEGHAIDNKTDKPVEMIALILDA